MGTGRTNNAVEGWHSGFQGAIQCAHPTVFRFVEALRKEENLQRARMGGIVAGEPLPIAKKYQDLNMQIRNIVNDRENRSTIDFLRSIAHRIAME